MIRIDVSGDGSCMLHSIALAYLMQVFDNDGEFAKRFKELFNKDQMVDLMKINEDFENIKKNAYNFKDAVFILTEKNTLWKKLIQRFRERLVAYIQNDKSGKSGENKYESFFASYHHEDYNTKTFSDYLVEIGKETAWLGELEMRAASDFLQYPIKVRSQSQHLQAYNSNLPGLPLELFHINGNHYNFSLDEGLAESLWPHLNFSLNKTPSYLTERPNQMESPSDNSDSSGDERSAKRYLFNAVEGNNFEEVEKILGNFESPINAQDANNDNNTPLHMAMKKRGKKRTNKETNKKIIMLLIEKGASGDVKNGKNETPLDLVERNLEENSNDLIWQEIKGLLEQSHADTLSESQEQTSGASKREPSSDRGQGSSSSRDSSEASAVQPEPAGISSNPSEGQRSDARRDSYYGGGKGGYLGFLYELKLLMLLVKKGIDKNYDFLLATEMTAAEKFDDVVIKYEDQGKCTYRFLQAKHRLDPENKKITVKDLTRLEDGDFSVPKYFISFCKIKGNSEFQGAELKDFVICTNTDFHSKLLIDKEWKNLLSEGGLNEDDILYLGKREKVRKLKVDSTEDIAKKIKLILLESALKTKVIGNLSSAKKKLESEKSVFYLNDLTTKAGAKIDVGQAAREILALKGKVLSDIDYKNLENAKNELYKIKKESEIDLVEAQERKGRELTKKLLNKINELGLIKDDNLKTLIKEAGKAPDIDKISQEALVLCRGIKSEDRSYEGLRKGLESAKKQELERVVKKMAEKDFNNKKDAERAVEKALDGISETGKKRLKYECEKLKKYQSSASEESKKLEEELDGIESDVKSQTLNDLEKKTTISEIELIKVALDDIRFESEVKEFIDKFCFVTQYPGVDVLDKIIKGTFKNEMEPFGKELLSLNSFQDLLYASFEKGMSDWFKSYNKGKREFISARQGAEFFKSIKKEINGLIVNALTISHLEKLRGYGINFKNNLKELKEFLSSKKQILHVSTQITRLSAIKVLQILKSDKDKYTYLEKCIFMCLSHLLRPDMQDRVMTSFSSDQSHDLLVIECYDETQANIDVLYKILSDVLDNKNKRIILIAQDGDKLAGTFKDEYQKVLEKKIKYQTLNDEGRFKDLDAASQIRILEKKVYFQGTEISLSQLIDENLADGIIDQASLSRLVEGEKIPIGDQKAFSSIGYVKDYYIERALHRQVIQIEVLDPKKYKDKNLGILFITGASQEDLTNLGAKKEDIRIWDGQTYGNWIILPSSCQGDQEIFQELGEKHPENAIHWLEYQKGKLTWRASKGHLSALNDHIDKNDVSDGNNALEEKYFTQPVALGQNVFILANDSGAGKSTVLTSLAHAMKQKDPVLWVVRVNLNDYAFDKKKLSDDDRRQNLKSLKEISLEKLNDAIEFVSEMAVPGYLKDSNIQLQRKLFKTGIENPKNADGQEFKKPKIVIFFDGFDEISPTYKAQTHVLLKALKESKVTQLWVTTRVHEKDDLEKELQSPAYILNPLTVEEQEEFLNKFWRWSLKYFKYKDSQEAYKKIISHLLEYKELLESLPDASNNATAQSSLEIFSEILQRHQQGQDTEKLESLRETVDKLDFSVHAKKLLKRWKESIGDTSKEFTHVPLNIRMLAEVDFEKKFQIPENLGLLNLYDKFIRIKLDIFKQEKAKAIQDNQAADVVYLMYSKMLSEIHSELALEELFKEEEPSSANQDKTIKKLLLSGRRNLEKLKKKFQSIKKDLNTEIQRVGLIPTFLSDDSPRFIHRSFAEYFFSEYLIRNLENEQVQKLLLEDILLKHDYTLIRKFFSGRLEVFFKYKSEREKLEKQLTEGKISKNKFDVELPKLKTHHLEHLLNINLEKAVKECLKKSIEKNNHVLHIAASEDHPAIVKFLIDKLKNDKETLMELVLKPDGHEQTALHLAAGCGRTKIVQVLLDRVKDHPNSLQALVERPSQYGKTALHLAAEWGRTKIVQVLLDRVKDHPNILQTLVERTEQHGLTALYLATAMLHTGTVQALLDGVKDHPNILQTLVVRTHKDGRTALYLAVMSAETVQAWLDGVKDHPNILQTLVVSADADGQTALQFAASFGFTKTVQTLLDGVKDHPNILQTLMEAADKDGRTALHLAASSGHTGTVQALLDKVKVHPSALQTLIERPDENGDNALHVAARGGHTETVLALLNWVKDHSNMLQALVERLGQHGLTALHEATNYFHSKIVQALMDSVKHNPNILQTMVERTDQAGRTALHTAAEWGRTETVQALLDGVKDHSDILQALVERPDQYGLTALHVAALCGRSKIVQVLLDGVKDHPNILQTMVERTDQAERTALHAAAAWGLTETVQALLDGVKDHSNILQALVERTDQAGQTALHAAAEWGPTETVQALLDGVKDHPNIFRTLVERRNQYGRTALQLAAYRGHTETVHVLLDRVKDHLNILQMLVERPDQNGRMALHLAAKWGGTETVQALLDAVKHYPNILQTLVEQPDQHGRTALHLAAKWGGTESMKALLDGMKDHPNILQTVVERPDQYGRTALHLAAERGRTETVQALLDRVKHHPNILQTLVERPDHGGQTALQLAAKWGNAETVHALLDGTKDHPNILQTLVEQCDENGQTVFLHLAAEWGHIEIVQALLDGVKDHPNILQTMVERPDQYGRTTLHLAARWGGTETVQALMHRVKHHPNILQTLVERLDQGGQTALHLGAKWGNTETVQALLVGVKDHPNILQTLLKRPDQHGKTALHLAVERDHAETVQTLSSAYNGLFILTQEAG